MKVYDQFSDDELIYLIRQQNEEAMELLFFRYKIKSRRFETAFSKQCQNIDLDVSELLLALEEWTMFAVSRYTFARSAFYSFWKKVIERKFTNILGYYRARGRTSGLPSLRYDVEETWILNESTFEEESLLESLLIKDNTYYLNELIKTSLKKNHQIALIMWMENASYEEIAKKLKIKKSNVSYLINSSIKIIKNIIDYERFK